MSWLDENGVEILEGARVEATRKVPTGGFLGTVIERLEPPLVEIQWDSDNQMPVFMIVMADTLSVV